MSEITNKELAKKLKELNYFNELAASKSKELEFWKSVQLAAERLEAMPEAGEQEPLKFCWDIGHVNWYLETGELCTCKKRTVTLKLYTHPQQPVTDSDTKKAWDKFQSLLSDDDPALSDKERIKRYCLEFYTHIENLITGVRDWDEEFENYWQQQSAEES